MTEFLLPYFLIINAVGFAVMLADKHRARKKRWRIPEATLMAVAIFGGSIGCLLGMYIFRHKTTRPKFTLGIPLILAVQMAIAAHLIH